MENTIITSVIDKCPYAAKKLLPEKLVHNTTLGIVREEKMLSTELLPIVKLNFNNLLNVYGESDGLSICERDDEEVRYFPLSQYEMLQMHRSYRPERLDRIATYGINTINQSIDMLDQDMLSPTLRNYIYLNSEIITLVKRGFQNSFLLSLEWAELVTNLSLVKNLDPESIYKHNLSRFLAFGLLGRDKFFEIFHSGNHMLQEDENKNLVLKSLNPSDFYLENDGIIHFKNREFDGPHEKGNICPAYEVPGFIKDTSTWVNNILHKHYWI